VNYSA